MSPAPSFIDSLRTMVGGPLAARGRDYAESGLVSNVRRRGGRVRATVHGTHDYAVTLDTDHGECTCPYALESTVCKHMVAVALIAGPAADDEEGDEEGRDLADYLRSLSHEDLVDRLLQAAADDETVEQRLRLSAAEERGDVRALRKQVDTVLGGRQVLDYGDAQAYAHEGRNLVAALDRATTRTAAADLVPIIERALGHVVEILQYADDSSGSIGDMAEELLAVHILACIRGKPDPVRLAKWLVRFALDDQDFFTVDVRDYTSALGEAGLAVYRTEIARRAQAHPGAFAPGYAAERLALLDRDPDAIVRLFGRDLDGPYRHASVAQAFMEIERYDDALTWACRGMDLPATWQSRSLFDLAAAVHAQRGELTDVLAICDRQLAALPDQQSYAALREAAHQVGKWDDVRPGALAELAKRAPRSYIEALISDDDIDTAWEAATGSANRLIGAVTPDLATRRAQTHPADAIPYYRQYAEGALSEANRRAYGVAARWLARLRDVHVRVGTDNDFAAYLGGLRETHRRRPAFLDELRRAGL